MSRVAVILLAAPLVAACGHTADDAERAFRSHRTAFEQARRIAVERAGPAGTFGVRLSDAAPDGSPEHVRQLTALLGGIGVEAVKAERDSVHGWHVTFTLNSSGLAIAGQTLAVAHGAERQGPYNEISEIRELGDGWYVSEYVW